jgi:hypothetical protein
MKHFHLIVLSSLILASIQAHATEIDGFPELKAYPHSSEFNIQPSAPTDYLLGLGALQKIGGRWRHKASESIVGSMSRYTWEINEDYTADQAFAWMQEQLTESTQLLFECEGRSCGSSAQWASRVFQQRVLYGHDERQHYLVLRLVGDQQTYTLILYGIDRANRRHYLHLDVLQHDAVE